MQLNTLLRDGVGILELRANFDGRALRVRECGESRFNARDLSLDKDIRVSGSQWPNGNRSATAEHGVAPARWWKDGGGKQEP